MSTLSAIILARSSDEILPETLASVAFCDEQIILTDPALVNFAAQRNRGLERVKGGWVLFVDSDEVVSPALATEIKRAIKDNDCRGYYLKRDDYFAGKKLHFGETTSVRLLRLAHKNAGTWHGKVHEIWKISGRIGQMTQPLIHYPHPTIQNFIEHINQYTTIRAAEVKNFSLFEVLVYPPAKFFQNFVLRLGFLDGLAGFVMAYMMSLHSLIVRIKTYDLSQAS
ncbi:glycosyltransferase family 2 protein [Candidatus Microgenomates bacterium]|nr:glycosyltransferase family 2 protein [Candidatus Microgenomates bacterium]